jgi:cytochrome P450
MSSTSCVGGPWWGGWSLEGARRRHKTGRAAGAGPSDWRTDAREVPNRPASLPACLPPSLPQRAVAGHDTSSSALTCLLAALAADPAAAARLAAEREAAAAAHGPALTPAALAAMPYATAAVRETLRLRPIVSGAMRVAERDVALSSGGTIPKGCPILMAFSSMAEREPGWAEDWGEFKPERFLNPAAAGGGGSGGEEAAGAASGAPALAPLPPTYNPFGIGQR